WSRTASWSRSGTPSSSATASPACATWTRSSTPTASRRAAEARGPHPAGSPRGWAGRRRGSAHERGADRRRDLGGVLVVAVALARPEEAAQPVLAVAGHDVHVEVGDGLADDVVGGDERPLGAGRLADRDRERAGVGEYPGQEVVRKVPDRLPVLARHEEAVAGKERAVVEEGQRRAVLEDDVGARLARHDGAEGAARHRYATTVRARGSIPSSSSAKSPM